MSFTEVLSLFLTDVAIIVYLCIAIGVVMFFVIKQRKIYVSQRKNKEQRLIEERKSQLDKALLNDKRDG